MLQESLYDRIMPGLNISPNKPDTTVGGEVVQLSTTHMGVWSYRSAIHDLETTWRTVVKEFFDRRVSIICFTSNAAWRLHLYSSSLTFLKHKSQMS
jgi:hypothetical protein